MEQKQMKKLISFGVPCYNSAAYMEKCVDSILKGGDEVEVIIVDDGSSDKTAEIGDRYVLNYPNQVKVIHQENGGHGAAVNAGLQAATGVYYKVVDSDDWLDEEALKTLLRTVRTHIAQGTEADLYITNFVYEHVADGTSHVSQYADKMPQNVKIGWDKVKKFRFSRMLLMHAVLFKRDVLQKSGTVLPKHTFYVDNLFAYKPLPFAKSIFYCNVNLYRYFIGRDDQSVNRVNFVKRYDQQIRVMKEMTDAYGYDAIVRLPKGLKKYMFHALQAVMMNTVYFACAQDSEERRKALKEMWAHIKAKDKKLYAKLRRRSYATAVNYLPWKLRGKLMGFGYDILRKKVKLG